MHTFFQLDSFRLEMLRQQFILHNAGKSFSELTALTETWKELLPSLTEELNIFPGQFPRGIYHADFKCKTEKYRVLFTLEVAQQLVLKHYPMDFI